MKFKKMTFKLLKSSNKIIECWSNEEKLFETNIDEEPALLENMKFFIGGQTDIMAGSQRTLEGVIRNVRIENLPIPKAYFFERFFNLI